MVFKTDRIIQGLQGSLQERKKQTNQQTKTKQTKPNPKTKEQIVYTQNERD